MYRREWWKGEVKKVMGGREGGGLGHKGFSRPSYGVFAFILSEKEKHWRVLSRSYMILFLF